MIIDFYKLAQQQSVDLKPVVENAIIMAGKRSFRYSANGGVITIVVKINLTQNCTKFRLQEIRGEILSRLQRLDDIQSINVRTMYGTGYQVELVTISASQTLKFR